MFIKQLREKIFNEINNITQKQAAVEQELITEKTAFDKEWNKWTTTKEIQIKQHSN